MPLSFRPADGDWLNLQRDEVIAYRQELDLRSGILRRRFKLRDKAGRETSIESRRLVHMHNPHLAAIEMTIQPENWSGDVEVMAGARRPRHQFRRRALSLAEQQAPGAA